MTENKAIKESVKLLDKIEAYISNLVNTEIKEKYDTN